MASTSEKIPLCVAGGDSLLSASYANKLIVPINALMNGQVAPKAGMGFIAYAGGEIVFDFTAADLRLRNLESTSEVDFSNIYARLNSLENRANVVENTVNDIITALDTASISANASCDNAGTITVNVTLTIPNIPAPI